MLADCTALRGGIASLAAIGSAIRFVFLLLPAAALESECKCGVITFYWSANQCGERSNAAFRRQSAAVLPSLAPHGVGRGYE